MLEIVESKFGDIVLVTCPHCGQYSEEDMQIIFAAYRDNAPLRHLDCGKDFYVELTCLTRADELRNEAVDAGQGMASHTEDDVVTVGRVLDERHTWQ